VAFLVIPARAVCLAGLVSCAISWPCGPAMPFLACSTSIAPQCNASWPPAFINLTDLYNGFISHSTQQHHIVLAHLAVFTNATMQCNSSYLCHNLYRVVIQAGHGHIESGCDTCYVLSMLLTIYVQPSSNLSFLLTWSTAGNLLPSCWSLRSLASLQLTWQLMTNSNLTVISGMCCCHCRTLHSQLLLVKFQLHYLIWPTT
jgi:hypothetical protein